MKKRGKKSRPQRAETAARKQAHRNDDAASPAGFPPLISGWLPIHSYALLTAATILCLLPFLGTAFHIDEPLFLLAAKQIARHPLDPYGFKVVWYTSEDAMSEVTKNPPMASYYIAMVGSIAGWSERTLHLAFLLPALGVVLGTYRLARRFCTAPLAAAAATVLTPGFLVSANSVMCDTLMLAFWIFAVILWIEGLEREKPLLLALSGLLIAASSLTKYFGMSLVPLLFAYSLARQRQMGNWAWHFLIPVLVLAGYHFWTQALYGRSLLLDAAAYANFENRKTEISSIARALVSLGFIGGCALPALIFAPVLWSRKQLIIGVILSALAGWAIGSGWMNTGAPVSMQNGPLISLQAGLFIAGGGCVLALAVRDCWKRKTADSLILALWVFGTVLFAGFVNWTINARSMLPLIPAAGILLVRRLETVPIASIQGLVTKVMAPLALSGVLSLWVVWGDAALADSARQAAALIRQKTQTGRIWFQGHWGFQYYMEAIGARPIDVTKPDVQTGDLVVIPENNTNTFEVNPNFTGPPETIEVELHPWLSTMRQELGAGFYANVWGPLPFAVGKTPPERYKLLRIIRPAEPQ